MIRLGAQSGREGDYLLSKEVEVELPGAYLWERAERSFRDGRRELGRQSGTPRDRYAGFKLPLLRKGVSSASRDKVEGDSGVVCRRIGGREAGPQLDRWFEVQTAPRSFAGEHPRKPRHSVHGWGEAPGLLTVWLTAGAGGRRTTRLSWLSTGKCSATQVGTCMLVLHHLSPVPHST